MSCQESSRLQAEEYFNFTIAYTFWKSVCFNGSRDEIDLAIYRPMVNSSSWETNMKIISTAMALFTLSAPVLLTLMLPSSAMAEAPVPRNRCWSKDIAMRPINDPQLRVSTAGRVVAIDATNRQQPAIGTQIRLRTDDGNETNISLEPSLSPRPQPKSIRIGDRLEIQGAKITSLKQQTRIVATTVKKGDMVWQVREPSGKPPWAKWCK
jgi:hypothetical protein